MTVRERSPVQYILPEIKSVYLDRLYRNLPLSDVLQPPHVRGRPEADKYEVSLHEGTHVFAALQYGVAIHSMTCIPEGNAAGVTRLLGHIPTATMQIIAGASSHSNSYYEPVGTGSDMFKVRYGEFQRDGTTAENALNKGSSAVGSVPEKLFAKFAELTAHMGYVPGSLIPGLIARAKAELSIEAMLADELYEEKYEIPTNKQFVDISVNNRNKDGNSDNNEEHITEIIDRNTGEKVVVWKTGEKVIREETVCLACGGVGNHNTGCPVALELAKNFVNGLERKGQIFIHRPEVKPTNPSSSESQTIS